MIKTFYWNIDHGVKFITLSSDIGPIHINVLHIVSIRKTNAYGRVGDTEISLVNGSCFYTEDSVQSVVNRIVAL